MKNIITIIVLSFAFSYGFSQQDSLLKTKCGNVILPQKGDFAIGIGANPIFNYFGNMFSSSGNNQLNLNLLNGNIIYGKYFLTPQSAFRLKFAISKSKDHLKNNVLDDNDNTKKVTDKLDRSSSDIDILVGYEKRKGMGRLQISYGAELGFNLYNIDDEYSYGNSFSATNNFPTSTINFYTSQSNPMANRMLKYHQDNGIAIKTRLFTGIEYFIFSKISIGGEIGLSYMNRFNGNNNNSYESWDFVNGEVKIDDKNSKTNSSSIDTDIFNGQIFLLFHFK